MNEYYIKFEMKGKFSIQTDVWQYNRDETNLSRSRSACTKPEQWAVMLCVLKLGCKFRNERKVGGSKLSKNPVK
jgi:hypothetical protein